MEDGSSIYEIGPPPTKELEEEEEEDFNVNLAERFSEESLHKISNYLIEAIEEDNESRSAWLQNLASLKPYLALNGTEPPDLPKNIGYRAYDQNLSISLFKLYSLVRAELLRQDGPAGFIIEGAANEFLEEVGEKRKAYINYKLIRVDKGYYPDYEKFLLEFLFSGTGFRKLYYDGITRRPTSRYIVLENFIVNNDCPSILESDRLTHVLHLSKREILLNQKNGLYRNIELSYLKTSEVPEEGEEEGEITIYDNGIDLEAYSKRSLFPIYECHTYLNLDEFKEGVISNEDAQSIPLPYIVVIDKITKKILSITKNWAPDDPNKERINYFIQYNCFPNFGIWGNGLAQLAGANAKTQTKILWQLLDAAALKNFPGGFRTQGFKEQQTDLTPLPGQFIPLDTGGVPLKDSVMPFPFNEPSGTMKELYMILGEQGKEAAGVTTLGMMDSKEDIPPATILALLEENNRLQSALLRSIHYSLAQELQLYDKLLGANIEYETFNFGQNQYQITSEDFIDQIVIVPATDPTTNSTLQRLIRTSEVINIVNQFPQYYNIRNVNKMKLDAIGFSSQDIENILLPEPPPESEVLPRNPVSENIDIYNGEPVKASIEQDHDAHIIVHGSLPQAFPDATPETLASAAAHIREHQVFKYIISIQQQLGIQLPPIDQMEDMEVQNSIAMAIASKVPDQTEEQPPAPIDPNALLIADIEQKEAETAARERIARLKAETDIFKAQLDFEKEKAKIESNEDIAQLKAETELTKQGLQNNDQF